jgi:GNAT superfamily N-acetyltransferase
MTEHVLMTIRPRRDDDDAAIAEIRHAWAPEYPKTSVERLAANYASNEKYGRQLILVAEIEGQVAGEGYLMQMYWTASPGAYLIEVFVAPEWGGHGAGGALYEHARRQAAEWGATRLSTDVREDQPIGMAFARKRGFQDTGHRSYMSRLDLKRVNLDGYEHLPERLQASGIRVVQLAQLDSSDESFLRRLHAMHLAAAADEPTPDPLASPFEIWRDGLLGQPGISPETVWIAFQDDRPIGITMLMTRSAEAGVLLGMSVDREFRGRGAGPAAQAAADRVGARSRCPLSLHCQQRRQPADVRHQRPAGIRAAAGGDCARAGASAGVAPADWLSIRPRRRGEPTRGGPGRCTPASARRPR